MLSVAFFNQKTDYAILLFVQSSYFAPCNFFVVKIEEFFYSPHSGAKVLLETSENKCVYVMFLMDY